MPTQGGTFGVFPPKRKKRPSLTEFSCSESYVPASGAANDCTVPAYSHDLMRERFIHSYAARLAFLIAAILVAFTIFCIRMIFSKFTEFFHPPY